MTQKTYCENCGTPTDAPNFAYHICVKPAVTGEDIEAVNRLRMYFRRNEKLVWRYGASDEGFTRWLNDVLRVIHAEDMKRVKKILEGGNA